LPWLIRFVKHDGPVERTGGDPRVQVNQTLQSETPCGASETTRPARNGVYFHNTVDTGCLRRITLCGYFGKEAVPVGR
jgi:hypothetical protein